MGLMKRSYEAFSHFLTSLEKAKNLDALVIKLRKALSRKSRSKEDLYVPPDSLVIGIRDRVRALGFTIYVNV